MLIKATDAGERSDFEQPPLHSVHARKQSVSEFLDSVTTPNYTVAQKKLLMVNTLNELSDSVITPNYIHTQKSNQQ